MKAKKPAKSNAKKAAAKPGAKSGGLRAAAERLKKAFGGKTAPKKAPAKVAVAKKTVTTKKVAAIKPKAISAKPAVKVPAKAQVQAAKPAVKMPAIKSSSIVAPKGLITEAQLRRMSDKDYMNDTQLQFFRHKLMEMRQEVLDREIEVKERLHEREVFADPADRATAEEEHWLDLRLRERESLLLKKIDEAIRRIDANEFGYCEKTGDPIGVPRLLARPTATVCVDVKGQDERVEAQFRDR